MRRRDTSNEQDFKDFGKELRILNRLFIGLTCNPKYQKLFTKKEWNKMSLICSRMDKATSDFEDIYFGHYPKGSIRVFYPAGRLDITSVQNEIKKINIKEEW